MKRILTILTISIIAIISVFAVNPPGGQNSAQSGSDVSIKLKGNTKIVDYTSRLMYGDQDVYDGQFVNSDDVLDLTVDSRSEDFSMYFSSNYVKKITISVLVTSSPFTRDATQMDLLAESGNQIVSLDTTVEGYPIDGSVVLPNGRIKDKKLEDFYIAWSPTADLAAGDYTSTITVQYETI